MAEPSLEMLMIAVNHLLDDSHQMKESLARAERYMARSEWRDAENLAMQPENTRPTSPRRSRSWPSVSSASTAA
jgi:hypothetical protein